ncbi:ABL1 [Mytilus coruscus]|uniref:ABL1 n=1 Tax=Mytilus coruscus TaxID=42192 RepID=A0A6J8CIP7_MYTCO|nr:ABL1 [Mytilus coruscus]
MADNRDEDDDFLDLCEENSSPLADPGVITLPKVNLDVYDVSSSPLPDPMAKISSVKNEDLCISISTCSDPDGSSLEDYSDIELEDSISSISPKKKSTIVQESFGKKDCNAAASSPGASESQTEKKLSSKYVQVISDESDVEKTEIGNVKKIPFEQSNSSKEQNIIIKSIGTDSSLNRDKVKGMSQWPTEENKTKTKSLIKRKPVKDDGGIINDVSPSKKLKPTEDKPKDEMDSVLDNVQREDNNSVWNKSTKEVIIKAAIHLKEMFPDLGAGQIGDKIKAVNNGTMSEQELIERVVEGICGNHGNTTSEDIQIAIANPKIQIPQNTSTQYEPVHKAKNQLSNSSKGKALLKRVVHKTEDMDIDMDFDVERSYDGLLSASPVARPEVIEIETNRIKLRWKHVDTSAFPTNDLHIRYVVEIQAPPAREWTTLSRNIAGTVYVVSNLKPEQDYQFRVRASSRFGELSEPSPVAVFSRNIGKPSSVTDDKPEWCKAVDDNSSFSIINSYDQFPWFHGYLTRCEAENLLRYSSGRNGSFLVRKTDIGVKIIGVLYEGSVQHYKISQDTNGKLFIFRDKKFSTLPDLINHYSICNEELVTSLQHCVPKVQENFTQPKEPQSIATKNETISKPVDSTKEEVSSSTMMCEACQSLTTCDKIVQCCDGHLNCNNCVEKVVKKVLSHGSEETNITCCYNECFECNSYIPESQAKKVLPSLIFELLEDKINIKASETIEKMTDLYSCPFCQYKVVIEGDLKKFDCPQCKSSTCRYCGKKWESSDHGGCTLNTFMANSDMDITSTWCTLPEGYKDFRAVPLDTGQQKEHMIEDIGKDNINEQHLFHGTDTSAVGGICRDGLDWRMCGLNGTAFGQGTYFAAESSYSERYCNIGKVRNIKTAVHRGFTLGSANQRPSFGGNNAIPLPYTQGFPSGLYSPMTIRLNSNQNQGFGFGTTATNSNVSGFFGGTPNIQTSGSNFAQGPFNLSQNIGFAQSQTQNNPTTQSPGFGFAPPPAASFGAANNYTLPVFNFGAHPVHFANAAVNNTGQEDSTTRQPEDIPIEEQFIKTTEQIYVSSTCFSWKAMSRKTWYA